MNRKDRKILCVCVCLVMVFTVFSVAGTEFIGKNKAKKCGGQYHKDCGCIYDGTCRNSNVCNRDCRKNCDKPADTKCATNYDNCFCKWYCRCTRRSSRTMKFVAADAPADGNGSIDFPYPHIQDAIDASISGDSIYVFPGIYNENININKAIELDGDPTPDISGNGLDCAIIDGGGSGNTVTITADGVEISRFIIRNCGNYEEDAAIDITSDGNIISRNIITDNGASGIYLHDSANYNSIYANEINNNDGAGIFIWETSNNNNIYYNNFENNGWYNVKDMSSNNWDDGYPSGGNYWDDYTGVDSDSDGIGDTPYNILGGDNQDRYPFMVSFGWNKPPDTPTITGPTTGTQGEYGYLCSYTVIFTAHADDPGSDDLHHIYIDWGDDSEQQIGWFSPNTEVTIEHIWEEQGNYTIRVKVIDEYGAESDWATLEVSMPKNKVINISTLLLKFLENHPRMFPLLQMILGL